MISSHDSKITSEVGAFDPDAFDTERPCKVMLDIDFADQLDQLLSPMDAAFALEEIVTQLPHSHKARGFDRLLKVFGLSRVNRCRVSWCDITFSYIAYGSRFFAFDVRESRSRFWPRSNCTLRGMDIDLDDSTVQ